MASESERPLCGFCPKARPGLLQLRAERALTERSRYAPHCNSRQCVLAAQASVAPPDLGPPPAATLPSSTIPSASAVPLPHQIYSGLPTAVPAPMSQPMLSPAPTPSTIPIPPPSSEPPPSSAAIPPLLPPKRVEGLVEAYEVLGLRIVDVSQLSRSTLLTALEVLLIHYVHCTLRSVGSCLQ